MLAWVERLDNDPENDVYPLDAETLPASSDHVCVTSGIEHIVKNFRDGLEKEARREPTQPFPTLYNSEVSYFYSYFYIYIRALL